MVDTPAHRRIIEYTAHEEADSLRAIAVLTDTWPWVASGGRTVHRMSLSVRIDIGTRIITEADAQMADFPHPECPLITPVFEGLAGMSVTKGFNKELNRRFAGPAGCSHLVTLARALAPAALLSLSSVTSRRHDEQRRKDLAHGKTPARREPSSWLRDSCHLWAADGIGEQKLALGWRPQSGTYPHPSLNSLKDEMDTPR